MARGVARSAASSNLSREKSSPRSIGVRADSPTRTLDFLLKKHGIHQLIVMGLIAHTCVESTVRFAAELGYDVALVKDATADYADEFMQAALVTNLPHYASAIVTTDEVVEAISSLDTAAAESKPGLQVA